MGETKKEKSKIRKWVDDHTVELIVTGGCTLIAIASGYYGFKVAVDKVTAKMASNAVDVCDYCGMKGAGAAISVLKNNAHNPELEALIDVVAENHMSDMQNAFYELADPNKITEMMFK